MNSQVIWFFNLSNFPSQTSQTFLCTLVPLDWRADKACQIHYTQEPSPHQGGISPEEKNKSIINIHLPKESSLFLPNSHEIPIS